MSLLEADGCNRKHLTLSCWLIGLLLVACISVSFAIGEVYGRPAMQAQNDTAMLRAELEPRVRAIETSMSAITARLESMQRTMDRVEKKLDGQGNP